MRLKLGQLIIDTTGGCRDTGVVVSIIYEDCHGDNKVITLFTGFAKTCVD